MRALLVFVFLVVLTVSVLAEQNVSLDEVFSSGGGITPPQIPGTMQEAATLEPTLGAGVPKLPEDRKAMVAPQTASSTGVAKEANLLPYDDTTQDMNASAGNEGAYTALTPGTEKLKKLVIFVEDYNTGEKITDAHIRITLDNGLDMTETLRYTGSGGEIKLDLEPAKWHITLKLDILDTSGKDYMGDVGVLLNRNINETVYMQPVGSLMGEVRDPEGRLVPGALVKFQCSGSYGILDSVSTDEFGSFSADWLPAGNCKVSALNGNIAGSSDVKIVGGEVREISIVLEQSVATDPNNNALLSVIAFLVIAAVGFVLYLKKTRHPKPKIEENREVQADRRMQDLISALDESEKKIVECLMQKGGKSMQNHLCRELGYPKSSMSRALGGLEVRGLITTEKLGRIKRVELSQWFLTGKRA